MLAAAPVTPRALATQDEQWAKEPATAPEEMQARMRPPATHGLAYVKKWKRSRHAVLFRLSNGAIQVRVPARILQCARLPLSDICARALR